MKIIDNRRGQIPILGVLVISVLVVVVLAYIVPMMTSIGMEGRLEGQGYVCLAAGEYEVLIAKIDDAAAKALAANNAAVLAANSANTTLNILRLHTENEVFLFPNVTNVNVTLTAPATPNTWKAWTEIAGNDTVTLSSKFAANSGYIRQMTGYEYSTPDKLIIIELAYDDDGTDVIGRAMMRSDFTWVLDLHSEPIPSGSTIYYRMMSDQANESIKANFQYYYD